MKNSYTVKEDGFQAYWFEGTTNREKVIIWMHGSGITERKERLRSTHYEEVSQAFKDASQAGVEFWEIQMDFKPEGVTLYSVTKSTDL